MTKEHLANKNNDAVKSSAQLPVANTSATITTVPKPDSSQLVAVANKKKETDLHAKENQSTQQPVKNISESNDTQKQGKPDLATIDNKKESTTAKTNINPNKPTQPPILKNDVAANVGGVQSSNGNNATVNKSSQTQLVGKKPDVVQVSHKE